MFRKYFEIDGHVLNVFHGGGSTLPGVAPDLSRGQCLVFVHGAGSNGGVWHRQISTFARNHSPIAFDLPGHGRSSGTEALASVAAYAEITLHLLDRLGVKRSILVGSSMGASIALDLALRAPERVEALVLMSCAAKISLSSKTIENWRQVMMGRTPQPFTPDGYGDDVPFEILREGWEHQVKTDPRVRYFDLVAANGLDFRPRLAEIRTPSLVIGGSKDPIAPPAACGALAAAIAGAKHVEIEGAGHYLYREKPEELHAAIDTFLNSL
jgi:pimeloyl-ACP methyl ester carboxylesterase